MSAIFSSPRFHWLLVAAAAFASAPTAAAQPTRVISASFYDPGNPDTGPFLPTTIAGVPPAQYSVPTDLRVYNWNDLVAMYPIPSGKKDNLFDSLGVTTPVDVQWIATDVSANNWQGVLPNGDALLMNGHLLSTTFGAQGLITVELFDLGSAFDLAAGYDLILYADTEWIGRTQSFTVDDGVHVGQAQLMEDVISDFPDPFDPALDYDEGTTDLLGSWIRFPGLTGDSLHIEVMSALPDEPAFLNGFQIVGYQPITGASADIDGDGLVKGNDFLYWQRGKVGGPSSRWLSMWQAQFGRSVAPSPLHAVPEPATALLCVVAVAGVSLAVRRRC